MNKINLTQIFFIAATFFFQIINAGQITKVKDNKALLTLDGVQAKIGDQVYGLTNQKKTSLMQITNIKNGKAVATILKGKAQVNDSLLVKVMGKKTGTVKSTPAQTVVTPNSKTSFLRKDLKQLSVNLKFSSDGISTKQDSGGSTPVAETVNMEGTNFGVNMHYGIPINSWFSIDGLAGFEMLKVAKEASSPTTCDGHTTADCNAAINYLTFGGLGKANYMMDKMQLWAGLGFGFKQPLTKKSTALTEENIALANALVVAFGLDYKMNNSRFIPISFEFQKSFNESDTVPAIKHFGLNIGYGFLF